MRYLNTYSLSSFFTVADGLVIAKSRHNPGMKYRDFTKEAD
jgi:hypothetical protein